MTFADALVSSWYAASFVAARFWQPTFTTAISAATITFSDARISMFLLSLTTLENWAQAERGKLRTSTNAKSLHMESSHPTDHFGKAMRLKSQRLHYFRNIQFSKWEN